MNGKKSDDRHEMPGGSSASRRASEWLVLLESGDATNEDQARFEAWLAEDPVHRDAYAALGETWARLTVMGQRVRAKGGGATGPDVLMRQLDVSPPAKRHRHGSAWAVAAAVLIAALMGGIVFLPGDPAVPYRTEVGERRTVSLADGSTVELNTDTELMVEYTDEQRRVAMTRGEAFFDVIGESDRPFIVTAGHGTVRAVGTGFAVRVKSADVVSVMVTDGLVEVTHSAEGRPGTAQPRIAAEPPVLQRGQRVEYDREATRVEEVTPAELERTQSWRRGLLVFEDASLAEVIAEVNRYTETRIVIADPAIGELRLGGTFKAGRPEALLEVLEKGFGIRVDRPHRDTIELHAATADSSPTTS